MADLARIKNNVAKMVAAGAPETDIDAYIAAEGTTVDAVRQFQTNTPITAGTPQATNTVPTFTPAEAQQAVARPDIVNTVAGLGASVAEAVANPVQTAGAVVKGIAENPLEVAASVPLMSGPGFVAGALGARFVPTVLRVMAAKEAEQALGFPETARIADPSLATMAAETVLEEAAGRGAAFLTAPLASGALDLFAKRVGGKVPGVNRPSLVELQKTVDELDSAAAELGLPQAGAKFLPQEYNPTAVRGTAELRERVALVSDLNRSATFKNEQLQLKAAADQFDKVGGYVEPKQRVAVDNAVRTVYKASFDKIKQSLENSAKKKMDYTAKVEIPLYDKDKAGIIKALTEPFESAPGVPARFLGNNAAEAEAVAEAVAKHVSKQLESNQLETGVVGLHGLLSAADGLESVLGTAFKDNRAVQDSLGVYIKEAKAFVRKYVQDLADKGALPKETAETWAAVRGLEATEKELLNQRNLLEKGTLGTFAGNTAVKQNVAAQKKDVEQAQKALFATAESWNAFKSFATTSGNMDMLDAVKVSLKSDVRDALFPNNKLQARISAKKAEKVLEDYPEDVLIDALGPEVVSFIKAYQTVGTRKDVADVIPAELSEITGRGQGAGGSTSLGASTRGSLSGRLPLGETISGLVNAWRQQGIDLDQAVFDRLTSRQGRELLAEYRNAPFGSTRAYEIYRGLVTGLAFRPLTEQDWFAALGGAVAGLGAIKETIAGAQQGTGGGLEQRSQ